MSNIDIFTKTKPLKLFLMVALPGAVSMVASSLWCIFDGIFVGNFLGETAFAALNLGLPFVMLNFALADLIGVGSSVPIAIALGQNKNNEANNYFTCACLLIFITGVLSGAILFVTAPYLPRLMGADGELARLSVCYIRVYAVASPFTTVTFAVDNFLRICGKIKSSMMLNILLSVLIFISEFICIAVLDMGISGSAFAVSLGLILCSIVALYPFVRKKLVLRFCKPQLHFSMLRQFVMNGSPTFLNTTASRLTAVIINSVLLHLGGSIAVSIYGVLSSSGDVILQLMYGTTDSLQPAVSYNWGCGNVNRVKHIAKCGVAGGAVISLAGMICMLILPETIVMLFLKESDAGILSLAVHALRIYSLTYLTRWFGFAVQGILVAVEKPVLAGILSISYSLVIPVVLLLALSPFGLDGIWLNVPVTSLAVSIMALIFIARLNKNISLKESL